MKNDSSNEVQLEWLESLQYSLDLGGWECAKPLEKQVQQTIDKQFQQNYGLDVTGGRFERSVGKLNLNLHIRVGIWGGEERTNFSERSEFIVSAGKLWEKYLNTAEIQRLTELIGMHFIEINGQGHPAFSTYDMGKDMWTRHYVIVQSNPVYDRVRSNIDRQLIKEKPSLGKELEFSLQFSLIGGSLQDFCSLGYLMDRVASSLNLTPSADSYSTHSMV